MIASTDPCRSPLAPRGRLHVPCGPSMPRLVARCGNAYHFFDARDVGRIWAEDRFSCLRAGGREHLLDGSLASLARRLGALGFLQVHRRELVNLHHVRQALRAGRGLDLVLLDGQRVTCSQRRRRAVLRALGLDSGPRAVRKNPPIFRNLPHEKERSCEIFGP